MVATGPPQQSKTSPRQLRKQPAQNPLKNYISNLRRHRLGRNLANIDSNWTTLPKELVKPAQSYIHQRVPKHEPLNIAERGAL